MKKLLLILLLPFCLCAEDEYDRFMVNRTSLLPNGGMGVVSVAYAYLEVPKALLDEPIPQSEIDMIHGVDEDGNSIVTGLTLRDFALNVYEFGDVAIFSVCSNERLNPERSRTWWMPKEDLIRWMPYLNAYGYTIDDLMDKEQYKARLAELSQ